MDIFDFMIWKARKTGKYYTLEKKPLSAGKTPEKSCAPLIVQQGFLHRPGFS